MAEEPEVAEEPAVETPHRHHPVRTILKWVAIALGVVVLLVACLFGFLQTDSGRRFVAHQIAPGLEDGGPLHIALAQRQQRHQVPVQRVDGGAQPGHVGAGVRRGKPRLRHGFRAGGRPFGGSVILHRNTVRRGGCPQQAFYI